MTAKRIFLAATLAALLFGLQLSKAQNCTDKGPVVMTCKSKSCLAMYSAPNGCGSGTSEACDVVLDNCCGVEEPVFIDGGCGDAMRNPIARKTLDLLSNEGIRISIIGCNLHLVLYRPPADPQGQGSDGILARRPLLPVGY
jgi:hypothetical protein